MQKTRWRNSKKTKFRPDNIENSINHKVIYGSFGSRFFATVMDMFLIIMPVNIVVGLIYGYESMKNPELHPTAGIIQMIIVLIITVLFWTISGQTPGKKALNLEIVNNKTLQKISLFQAIIRYLAYFLSMISLIGFFMPLLNKQRKTLHDIIAGTIVIQKNINN